MAISAVVYQNPHVGEPTQNTRLPVWLAIANGNVGERVKVGNYNDATVQIKGTFGVGGSVTMRGSDMADPDVETAAHWFTITDAQANAITKTAAAGEVHLEAPMWLSPIVTAGDGTTAIDVHLKLVKGK